MGSSESEHVEALQTPSGSELGSEESVNKEYNPDFDIRQSSSDDISWPGNTPVKYASITTVFKSIKATVKIDSSISVPISLRPPLAPDEKEETRKNLLLKSVHGNIDADITLVKEANDANELHDQIPARNERVVMKIYTIHKVITAKIHGSPDRSPFTLLAESIHGEIFIEIPRTFHGPLIVSHVHGTVQFSDDIEQDLIVFGEARDRLQRCFLGEFSSWSASGSWMGDVLLVDNVHGNVSIQYGIELVA